MGISLFGKATDGNKAAGPPAERILAELKSSRMKSWDAQVAVVESLAELKDAKDVELCQPAVRYEVAYIHLTTPTCAIPCDTQNERAYNMERSTAIYLTFALTEYYLKLNLLLYSLRVRFHFIDRLIYVKAYTHTHPRYLLNMHAGTQQQWCYFVCCVLTRTRTCP
jgi:cellobiose-specific phosphotransferase system component IIB